jgi:hypothetical protein
LGAIKPRFSYVHFATFVHDSKRTDVFESDSGFFAPNTDHPHHDQYVNTMKPYDKLSVTVVFLPDAPNPLFYRNFCVLVERCAYALTNWQQSGIS